MSTIMKGREANVYETKKKSCHPAGGDACTADDAAASGKSGGSAGDVQRQPGENGGGY